MKDRIQKFMQTNQLSSQKFAEEISVQPSGISHILSGRNKPSFDFIQKILLRYPELNAEWLIIGKGDMYKSTKQGNLFVDDDISELESVNLLEKAEPVEVIEHKETMQIDEEKNEVEKIVIFYSDATFKEYKPGK